MLVATGRDSGNNGQNFNEKNHAQVVDLSLTNDCATFPAYPISMAYSAGSLINNILTVCGGYDSSGNRLDTCYKYDMAANEWTFLCSMQSKRNSHAAATLPDGSLWITGEYIVAILAEH